MKKRILSVILVIAQLLMVFSMTLNVSAASARSAKKVLKDIISVKEEWDEATTQRKRDKLHQEAEELREELLLTKEYRKDIRVSDRNFMVTEGDDPGFQKMVDVLCFAPYDTKENVEQVLNYVKAYNKSFWGTVCIASGGIVFAGVLIYGAVTTAPTVITGAGMKIAAWETAVINAINAVAKDANKIHHILQEKHAWNSLVTSPTWNTISTFINKTLLYGEELIYKADVYQKQFLIDGYMISVTYKVVDGIIRISDAWVITK